MNREIIRTIFLTHGFVVKDGQTDLKPYVYEAAEALLKFAPASTTRLRGLAAHLRDNTDVKAAALAVAGALERLSADDSVGDELEEIARTYAAWASEHKGPIVGDGVTLSQAIEAAFDKMDQRIENLSAYDGWVLMPRELTERQVTFAQGAFMDMSWSATECFAARYAELIQATEAARAALTKRST